MSSHIREGPPLLPNEIWRHIFELATHVPGVLDPVFHDPFEPGAPFNLGIGRRYKEQERHSILKSINTKSIFVRVCRRWHALALPLLYQVVVIRESRDSDWHPNDLTSLCSVFNVEQRKGLSDVPIPGSYVRRLDMSALNLEDRGTAQKLSKLVASFSNLRILSISEGKHYGEEHLANMLWTAVGANCSATLEKLVWKIDTLPGRSLFGSLLTRFIALRTMILKHNRPLQDLCPLDFPTLPNLNFVTLAHSQETQCIIPSGHSSSFPNVRQALFYNNVDLDGCSLDFLDKISSSLTTLYLVTNIAMAPELCRHFTSLCPQLRHIVLLFGLHPMSMWQGAVWEEDRPILSSVTHLGILLPLWGVSDFRPLFAWLEDHVTTPLQVVRFFNPALHANMLAELIPRLAGLRVEDDEGNELSAQILQRSASPE